MLKKTGMFLLLVYIVLVAAPSFVPKNDNETVTVMAEETSTAAQGFTYNFPELEDYVCGVVAAEMPAEFETEALKAQAVCARTYAVKNMEERGSNEVPYDIYQAYCSVDDMKQKWGDSFDKYYEKISSAVKATKGEIMIYENEPVLAVFHSTSAGKTENSENIWGGEVSYLKSVDSSFDENAPNFLETVSFDIDEIKEKLGDTSFNIKERTEAGYVKTVVVGDIEFTGREVREMLGLRSSNFDVEIKDNKAYFTTKGFGHGAGLSQYGANFMAQNGSTYTEILNHYYTDIDLAKIKLKT